MTPLQMLFILLVAAVPVASADATPPTPVCRSPTVVDAMAQALHVNPAYARIDPARIAESPTPDPLVVRCDVCVNILFYDTAWFGDVPVLGCEPHAFQVRALPRGFVVQGWW